MRLALLSDTHGNLARTRRALALMQAEPIDAVLHAGDIGSTELLDLLAQEIAATGIPVHAVAGNVDEWEPEILRHHVPFPVRPGGLEFTDGSRSIFLIHGHDTEALESAIASGRYTYVIHGHTHLQRDERIGPTRIINPGAIHRSPQPSFALLDTSRDALRFIALKP